MTEASGVASGTDPDVVELEVEIAASPQTVFSFLIDPARMVAWIGRIVEIDPRPGGVLQIDVNGRDVVRGEIVELDPPRFVAFTWGWDRAEASLPPGASRVEITLEPKEAGTLLRLRHLRLPPDVREEHRAGWRHYLARMQTAAAGGDPGSDPLATPDIVHGTPDSLPADPGEGL